MESLRTFFGSGDNRTNAGGPQGGADVNDVTTGGSSTINGVTGHPRATAALQRHLGTGTLTPQGEGENRYYRATGGFSLSLDLNAETPPSVGSGGGVSVNASCGGAIHPLVNFVIPYSVELPPRRQAA